MDHDLISLSFPDSHAQKGKLISSFSFLSSLITISQHHHHHHHHHEQVVDS